MQAIAQPKARDAYRNYDNPGRDTRPRVLPAEPPYQTFDFVRAKRAEFLRFDRRKMTPWEALDFLNTLVDDSDPDIELSQIEHLLQTAEAIRADGHPRLVRPHRPDPRPRQGAVPVRRAAVGRRRRHVSRRLRVLRRRSSSPSSSPTTPTARCREYQTGCGIYEEGCGLDNVLMSWGHDEYMYHVVEGLPARAGAVHDPLPLVLRLAPRGRVRLPDERRRPRDAALGAEVQSLRPLLLAAGGAYAKTLVYCSEGSPRTSTRRSTPPAPRFDANQPDLQPAGRVRARHHPARAGAGRVLGRSPTDGLVYTFQLRKGVKWQTTKTFTPTRDFNADDVIFTFERQWTRTTRTTRCPAATTSTSTTWTWPS